MPSLTLLNKPDYLLPQVVTFLTRGWSKKGILDLSEILLVLPTQESQRRLHEALVREAASFGAALLPPRWMLPMHLPEEDQRNFASSSLEQILWIQVIVGMTPEESQRLFPRKSPRLDPLGSAELADAIRRLRGELSQVGISLREAGTKKPEDPRWKALISLEERYLALIAKEGATDRITAQLAGAENPRLPLGAKRLVIAGVPDLPKVYETMIPKIKDQGIPVDLLVHDPANKGEGFYDSMGRPGAAWEKTPIPIDRKIIHLCLDPAEEAEKAALLTRASGGTGSTSVVAVTSPDLAKVMQDGLEALDISAFNPAGTSLDMLPLGRLFTNLSELLRENDFRSALQLLRYPHIQYWLGMDPEIAIAALDALQNHLIPSSLAELLTRWPEEKEIRFPIPEHLHQALQKLHLLILELKEGSGSTPLLKALQEIYASVDLAKIPGGRESSERIREWISGSESLMEGIPTSDILTLLLAHLKSGVCMSPKQPGSVELPGWLELLWEDAPHLIVTGMNDGQVPEMRQGDPFLNESLRTAWHLPSDSSRLRRDSYLLTCLIAARSEERGRIDLLLARQDEEGGALKPSRLLLRCAEDVDLPVLVKKLFRELPPRPGEQWRSAWALRPERKISPRTLSASALKDYLGCPTRFYLKHLLKLKKSSFGVEEADATTFGILLHNTLSEFGNDPKLKNLREQAQIQSSLVRIWKDLFEARYGRSPSFPLLYQREVGIRRLQGVALAQARARAEGWEIVACECRFTDFPVAEMKLRGQIDRIDRRATQAGSEWRIIDYKSSDKEKDPLKEHYRSLGKQDDREHLGAYECFEKNGKTFRWIDLQLPIYQMVLLAEIEAGRSPYLGLNEVPQGPIETGYLILPSRIDDTRFVPFTTLEEHDREAQACLEGILGAIQRGIFWPPRQPKYDDFEYLLFQHLKSDPASGQQTLDPVHLHLLPFQQESLS